MDTLSGLLARLQEEFKFIDLRFTDTPGQEHHITIPVFKNLASLESLFTEGKMFDGSSFMGWRAINQSDMMLMPDITTAAPDPFMQEPTCNIRCNLIDPNTHTPYTRDPRSIASRAEAYLRASGIADEALLGPEPEFFIFDSVRWKTTHHASAYSIDSAEGAWNTYRNYPEGNMGHRPRIKGGYFPVPPVDSSHNIRSEISLTLEKLGILVEAHHHEVATGNQNEIATRYNSLLKKADEIMTLKYVIRNIAAKHGKTATFMPKPIMGDNGSGMHCHFSLSKQDRNLFSGHEYAGLSHDALFFIGGVIQHARALNVLTNPSTNSYKRLVPGFEAPVMLAYSSCNRSAAIRVPHVSNPRGRRIEIRFPDPSANPYLAFSALLMAGLDGIVRKIHPGQAMDQNLYELSSEQALEIPRVSESLSVALAALENDSAFLRQGDVFSQEFLDSFIAIKHAENKRIDQALHPLEFDLYYSV
jgi:glutamine synthetase